MIIQSIFQLTLAILEETLSLSILMAIDYLSTCCVGGIIKHSTGLARSDARTVKHRGRLTEELSNISNTVSPEAVQAGAHSARYHSG